MSLDMPQVEGLMPRRTWQAIPRFATIVACAVPSLFCLGSITTLAADVAVNNRLSACITVEQKGVTTEDNLLVLSAQIASKKLTSECGCFSASVTYTSYIKRGRVKD